MRKIVKYTSIAFGAFCLVIIILGIILNIYLTKDRVVQLIEQHINARVEIKDISVPLWATFSGITLQRLKVGYRDRQVKKEPSKRKPMGKPIVGFEEFNFKVAVLKLFTSLGKNFELKTLLFTKPEAHVILYAKGGTNLDSLFSSPPSEDQKSEKNQKIQKEKKKTKKSPQKPSEPFSIKSIDTVIKVGKIGIERGNFSVNLQKFGNTLKLHNVDAYVDDILIDPKDLYNKNRVRFKFSLSALFDENNKGKGAVRSFVINFKINGRVQPFDPKTGKVTQRARLKVGLLSGTKFTGLALLKKTKDEVKLLKKAGINLAFLKDKIELNKDAIVDISFHSGIITFKSSPRIDTNDYLIRLKEGSRMSIKTMNHNFITDLVLNEKVTQKIRGQVEGYFAKVIKVTVKRLPTALKSASSYLKASTLTSEFLAPAIDKETNCFRLSINSRGSFSNPDIVLVKPRLGDPEKEVRKVVDKQLKNLEGTAKRFIENKAEIAKKIAKQEKKEALMKIQAIAEQKKREAKERLKMEAKRKAKAGLRQLGKKIRK